jgi:ribosomal-protein-alanine N-acetyltransferase
MSLVQLQLQPLKENHLNEVVELDKLSLGGLWTLEGYQSELSSPNSCLLGLSLIHSSNLSLKESPKVLVSPLASAVSHELTYSTASAIYQEQLIGCGCFWQILEEAHITLLAIHPDYQGQGLGQLLLYALLEDAVKRKLERATLEVRESNQVALSVYKKFGFRVAGKRKKYYQSTEEDALVLWRGDLHHPSFQQDLATWQQALINKLLIPLFIDH